MVQLGTIHNYVQVLNGSCFLSLSSTTNFLSQFSMTNSLARVDGQPASFDNCFIDK